MGRKPARRLYSVDVEMLPWTPDAEGLRERTLTRDDLSGARTRYVRADANQAWAASEPLEHWTELYVVSGALREADVRLDAGSYYSLAPGERRPALHALTDAVILEFSEARGPRMDKESVRRTAQEVRALPVLRPEGAADGITHRVLAEGSGGSMTRLLEVLPFVSTGVFVHDHSEEVVLLEGSYKMGDEFHPTGTYTCKGPDVEHGPFLTATGYVGLEVRNYSGS